ncbi:alpha/beta hydrolase [Nocardia asteroides]|uniref:alpha/beta hydrolase n=1 Tax=Nocardia asteroides TaxID=1824 RepID=UPI0037CC3B0B
MLAAAVTATAQPSAPCAMPAGSFETAMVASSMGPIPVQIRWARRCGQHAILMLDGMRARNDSNGWAANTDVLATFADDDVTVVMPVGGSGSWYADWDHATAVDGRLQSLRWETFLASELPDYLAQFGVARTGHAVVGLSMSASTAVTLVAHHRDQYSTAAAFSGALDWHSPDMRHAIQAATVAVGRDVDDFAAPGSGQWNRLDPMTSAPLLSGAALYVAVGTGVPDLEDLASDPLAAVTGIGLEMITTVATHRFKQRLDSLGIPATYHFPATGSHNWRSWNRELALARPWLLSSLGVTTG